MITAKVFVAQGSVWRGATPSLEQFTRWVNSNSRQFRRPVPRTSDADRSSLIAETAFERIASMKAVAASDAEAIARTSLDRLPGPPRRGPLTDVENREVSRLADNLDAIVRIGLSPDATVHPRFPGCGYVSSAVGDFLIAHELIEVKTVERGFRGIDFRQALTYSALAYAAGTEIQQITLLNPRRGIYFRSGTTQLARDLGAASWIDLMQTLVNAMTDISPSQ